MNKIIPFGLKIIGLILVVTSIFIPLLTISMSVGWQNDVKPPGAPDGTNLDFLSMNGLGITINNVTFDDTTNSFVEAELDPNSDIASTIDVVNQIIVVILGIILLLVGIAAIFSLIFGRSKLGGLVTILGGLGGVIFGGSILIIQGLLFKALETAFGVSAVGDTLTYSQSQTILTITYTLEFSLIAAIGISAYLAILGGIVILASLFIRADETNN